MIVTIIIGSISYINLTGVLKQQAGEYNYAMLEEAAYIIEGYLRSLDQLINNIILDTKINSFIYVNKNMTRDELYEMSLIIKKIAQYKASNDFIDDLYIYFRNIDSVLTKSTRYKAKYYYENFSRYSKYNYEEWLKVLQQSNYKRYIPEQEIIVEGNAKKVITCLQSLPIIEKNNIMGMIVATIDTTRIQKLLENIDLINKGVVYITDGTGQVIISVGNKEYIDIYDKIKFTDSKYFYSKSEQGEIIISHTLSKTNQWRYVSIIPVQALTDRLGYIKRFIIKVLIIEILIGMIISYLLTKKNYHPIKITVEKLKEKLGSNKMIKVKDELTFIEEATLKALYEGERVHTLMEKQKPIIRTNMLSQLLKGNIYGLDYKSFFDELDIRFEFKMFCVITINVENFNQSIVNKSLEQKTQVKLLVSKTFAEMIETEYKCYSVDMDLDQISFILNLQEKNSLVIDKIKEIATKATQLIAKNFSVFVTIAIGGIQEGLEGIATSYRESKHALEYKLIRGEKSVIAFEDINKVSQEYVYSMETESQLLNLIRTGKSAEVMSLLDQIFEQNFKKNTISIELARCLFFDIMSTGLKVLNSIQIDYEEVFGADFQPVKEITSCNNIDDMNTTLKYIFSKICEYIQQNKKSNNESLKNKIISFIDKNYSNNALSLTLIADSLLFFAREKSSILQKFFPRHQWGIFMLTT